MDKYQSQGPWILGYRCVFGSGAMGVVLKSLAANCISKNKKYVHAI